MSTTTTTVDVYNPTTRFVFFFHFPHSLYRFYHKSGVCVTFANETLWLPIMRFLTFLQFNVRLIQLFLFSFTTSNDVNRRWLIGRHTLKSKIRRNWKWFSIGSGSTNHQIIKSSDAYSNTYFILFSGKLI